MNPAMVLSRAAEEFRLLAQKFQHNDHSNGPHHCQCCRLLILAEECDAAAIQLES